MYLDCDRPGLSADEPIMLLAEAVRQLGLQFRSFNAAAQHLRNRWLQDIARGYAGSADKHRLTTRGRTRYLEEFRVFVRDDLHLGDRNVLFVIDTFEEVQYRSAAAAEEVFAFLGELQQLLPRLRTVLAGRNPARELRVEPMEIGELDDQSAQAFLETLGVTSSEVRRSLARLLHGNPLTLRLAAEVVALEEGKAPDLESLIDDTEIQGVLYNRILGHVHHDDVKRIAHPGLILRRITADIIRKVLAQPCALGAVDETRAAELFELLGDELSLVTLEGNAVRHRADVRRVMLPALKKDQKETVREVQEAAVRYYKDFDDVTSRAEEIYHRLSLGHPVSEIDARWLPGVDESLRSAVDELEGASRAYLASRLRIELDDQDWNSVDQATWEEHVAMRVIDLLSLDRPLEAVRILRRRAARISDSRLYWLHAQALSRCGQALEARELARQAIGAALRDPGWSDAYELRGESWTADQLVDWFTGPSAAPSAEDVQVRIKWLERLHPLHVLAGRSFVGRNKELAAIESYVSGGGRVLDLRARPPLLVQGPAGSGKSALVASFVLDRLSSIWLVYLDCDALNLSPATAENPLRRLLEQAFRQLALQVPIIRETADLLERVRVAVDTKSFEPIAGILPSDRILVFVIDAVELLQDRSRDYTAELYSALEKLQQLHPRLRTILISRGELPGLAHETLTVGGLDAESVQAYLAAEGIEPQELRQRIVDTAGGNPTALRLSVELVKREGPQAFEGVSGSSAAMLSGSGATILAALTQRLFARIHDPEVSAIAAPALLVRQITPGVIRHVIAGKAGVVVDADEKAVELFESLEAEATLFTRDGEALRPRGDVRRTVVSGFRRERPEVARSIDEAAVRYYEAKEDVTSRAEEIYHRLMLGQASDDIDARWVSGVEDALRGAIGDLAGPARAYLAATLGLDLQEIDWSAADQPTWERYIAQRARDLIVLERYADAVELLRQRSTRLPRSSLFALEAEALLRGGGPRDALLVARRGLTVWPDDPVLPKIVADCEALLGASETSAQAPPAPSSVGDVASYQLRQEVDPRDVASALASALPTSTDVMNVIQQLHVTSGQLPAATAGALVAWAKQEGRLDEVVTAVAAYRPESQELRAFLDRSTVRIDSRAVDPIAAVRFRGGALIFGRLLLRDFLRGIVSGRKAISGPGRQRPCRERQVADGAVGGTCRPHNGPSRVRVHVSGFTDDDPRGRGARPARPPRLAVGAAGRFTRANIEAAGAVPKHYPSPGARGTRNDLADV